MRYKAGRGYMLKATITTDKNTEELQKLFLLEEKNFQNDRATYTLRKIGKLLEFEVTAKDSVALRSVLNAITKIITINEKSGEVLQDE